MNCNFYKLNAMTPFCSKIRKQSKKKSLFNLYHRMQSNNQKSLLAPWKGTKLEFVVALASLQASRGVKENCSRKVFFVVAVVGFSCEMRQQWKWSIVDEFIYILKSLSLQSIRFKVALNFIPIDLHYSRASSSSPPYSTPPPSFFLFPSPSQLDKKKKITQRKGLDLFFA